MFRLKKGSFSNVDIKEKKGKKPKKTFDKPNLIVSIGPHLRSNDSIAKIMWITFSTLLPAAGWSVYIFGQRAMLHILVAIFSCMIVELLMKFFRGTSIKIWDGSAAVTGILIAFNMPYNTPYFVTVIASIVAIAIVKEFFGGLGTNFLNPALVGRAFVMFAAITHMSNIKGYMLPDTTSAATSVDVLSSATPMSLLQYFNKGTITGDKLPDLFDLFIGKTGGSLGEISALLLILGGLFLLYKGYIRWQVPVFFIGTVFAISFIYSLAGGVPLIKPEYTRLVSSFNYSLYHILGGGLMLGAFFMATDMVTTPVTGMGNALVGLGCGVITSMIRIFGQYPEGVMFSILLMNIATPLISKLFKPRIYGMSKRKAKGSEA